MLTYRPAVTGAYNRNRNETFPGSGKICLLVIILYHKSQEKQYLIILAPEKKTNSFNLMFCIITSEGRTI